MVPEGVRHFPGGPTSTRGGGGGGGVQLLIPYRNGPYILWFSRGGGGVWTPCPPSGSALDSFVGSNQYWAGWVYGFWEYLKAESATSQKTNYSCTPDNNIADILSWGRGSYPTHVVLSVTWGLYVGCIGAHAHVTSLLCQSEASCDIASQRFQGLQGAYFKIKS